MGAGKPKHGELNRRSFIKSSAGAAAGAAIVVTPAAVALKSQAEQPGVVTDPSKPAPREPVMAYVRDAERGEVTVTAGTEETTYRDPVLVKRMLAAAPQVSSEGGTDVIAP
jgi:hypothetical protein